MASPSPSPSFPLTASQDMNGDSGSAAPLVVTANDSVQMPQDLLYEILLCLSAKPLCRFRAVCRSWRSLLSDSSFVAAHKARHRHHHLLVADLRWETSAVLPRVDFHILDTSGHRVRQIPLDNAHAANLNWRAANRNGGQLLCLVGADNRARVIDPATGVVCLLPDDHLADHFNRTRRFALGRSSRTGDTKVLAIAARYAKILTLGVGAGEWRATGFSPANLLVDPTPRSVALVKGVLYFLACKHGGIASYDLEKEKWRRGLLNLPRPVVGDNMALAELSGSLVAVYGRKSNPNYSDVFMDLWFLTNSEEVPWSQRYTITMPCQDLGCRSPCGGTSQGYPLWELDDGRILLWVLDDKTRAQWLQLYDPRTNTFTDGVEMSCRYMMGVYKGSLLAGLP